MSLHKTLGHWNFEARLLTKRRRQPTTKMHRELQREREREIMTNTKRLFWDEVENIMLLCIVSMLRARVAVTIYRCISLFGLVYIGSLDRCCCCCCCWCRTLVTKVVICRKVNKYLKILLTYSTIQVKQSVFLWLDTCSRNMRHHFSGCWCAN